MEQAQLAHLNAYGMDVTATMARFGGNEALMMRFLLGFPNDKTYGSLVDAVEAGDRKAVEAAAHSLKGLTGNLGLTPLFEASTEMMNALRADENRDYMPLFEKVKAEYEKALALVSTLG